jgi:hypothetical protein
VKEREEESFEGLLVPMEWTDDGKVSAVGISTNTEQELRIAAEALARLLPHLRRRVRVTGKVDRERNVIELSSYHVLHSLDERTDN